MTSGGSEKRTSLRDHGYVTFLLNGQWLGVPVVLIQEVLRGQPVAPVPLSTSEVQGLLNLRGQIVTAVDLRAVLGLPPRQDETRFMNVVVRHEDELFSLIVDEVGDVLEVDRDGIEATPKTLDPVWSRCSQGVARMERGLMVILDVGVVLERDPARVA